MSIIKSMAVVSFSLFLLVTNAHADTNKETRTSGHQPLTMYQEALEELKNERGHQQETPARVLVESPGREDLGAMTIVEQPPIVEVPVVENVEAASSPEPTIKKKRSRRKGPRKFR